MKIIQESLWILRYCKKQLSPRQLMKKWWKNLAAWIRFWKDYKKYNELAEINDTSLLKNLQPCLGEDTEETFIEPIYFYQDTWAFEKILRQSPKKHVDVGSHHKFIAFLSKVVPVLMVDIRPLSLPLDSIQFEKGSILNLPFKSNSISSISSLCVVEHIGLGRYGDPLNPSGSEEAISELCRVLCSGGNLYLSLPIDSQNRTCFNAHRAFEESYIERLIMPMKIVDRLYIYESKLVKEKPNSFCIALYHIIKE